MSKKVYDENVVMTALIVWEAVLEKRQLKAIDEAFDHQGQYEMRNATYDKIAPWVEELHELLEKEFGDEPLIDIGMEMFDWDFVPYLIEHHVTWTWEGPSVPPATETLAKLIALKAMGQLGSRRAA